MSLPLKKRITSSVGKPFKKCPNCGKISIIRHCMNCSIDCCLTCSNKCTFCDYVICEGCYNDWIEPYFGIKVEIKKDFHHVTRIQGEQNGVFTYFVCYRIDCMAKGKGLIKNI